jgi:group II intron reverse transcriptase/maturase
LSNNHENHKKVIKRTKLRHNEYYSFQDNLDNLYKESQKNKHFTELYDLVTDERNILLAYRNIKSNKGAFTKGVDGRNIKHLAELEPKDLISLVRNKLANYQPQTVKRVEIPKSDGSKRPLGIPTISDRLVQQCILQIMEPICEAKFYKHSYGFRPMRGTREAIAKAYFLSQKNNLHYTVDIDIKGFFDNIDHGKLIKQIWSLGIRDKRLISIISKLLRARVDGIGIPSKGTPQGGILSPLLANIVLNELDWWIASQWEQVKTKHDYTYIRDNKIELSNKYASLRKFTSLKEVYIVRYADDFKIFCRNHDDARRIFAATNKWLKERLGLNISQEKSGIVNLRKNYSEFLGIKFKVITKGKKSNKKSKYVISSYVGNKAFKKILAVHRAYIKKLQRPDSKLKIFSKYNATLIGWHNYYSMATNCNVDFMKIDYRNSMSLKRRLKPRKRKKGESIPRYIDKMYGQSKQLRIVNGITLIPLGFVKHRKVMNSKQLSPYVENQREQFHVSQKSVDVQLLQYLVKNPIYGQSSEYNDNRISLLVAQHGKCYVTRKTLDRHEIHCHHKSPREYGGKDEYKNLVILHKDIHKLIHATKSDTITNLLAQLNLNKEHITKVNALRIKAKVEAIS